MAEDAHSTPTSTTPPSRRRTLFAAAGAVIMGGGITAGAAASVADLVPTEPASHVKMTPITTAAMRLAHLSAMNERDLTDDENDAVSDEQLELSDLITEAAPQTIVDAMVLLMVASAETRSDHLHEDGTFSHERGDIMVRRVMHFLAGHVGVSLADHGGAFLLSTEEHEALALEGTVAQAAARFNGVDAARASERHDDYRYTTARHLIMARHGMLPSLKLVGRT